MIINKRIVIIVLTLAAITIIVIGLDIYNEDCIYISLPEDIVSVSIQSSGNSVSITDVYALERIVNMVDGVKMVRISDRKAREPMAPGAGYMFLYFFSPSRQYNITFPVCKFGGKYYSLSKQETVMNDLYEYLQR